MNITALIIACVFACAFMGYTTFTYFTTKNKNILVLFLGYLIEIALSFALGVCFGLIPSIPPVYGVAIFGGIMLLLIICGAVFSKIGEKLLKNGQIVSNVHIVQILVKSTTTINDEIVSRKYQITFEDMSGNLYTTIDSYDINDVARLNKMGSKVDIRVKGKKCIVVTEIDKSIEVTEDDYKDIEIARNFE